MAERQAQATIPVPLESASDPISYIGHTKVCTVMTSTLRLSVLALAVLALAALAGCQQSGHNTSIPPDSTQSPVATYERPSATPQPTETPARSAAPEPRATPATQRGVTAQSPNQPRQPTFTIPPPTTPPPTATAPAPGAESDYIAVATGSEYTCALKADGAVFCWGAERDGELPAAVPAPDVTLKSISAGADHACGIRTDGAVVCWGSNKFGDEYSGKADPPAGEFMSVSAGNFHTCGVRTDSTLACWGLNDWGDEIAGLADPPNGAFASVSVGAFHTCGIRTDGTVTCWTGLNDLKYLPPSPENPISPPPGAFLSVSASAYHSCGLRADGELVCWGYIAVGPGGDCTFYCAPETAPAQEVELPAATFQQLPDGGRASCGITSDGSILCWGWPLDRINPPKGKFVDVSAGYPHACGLRIDGAIVCWAHRYGEEVPRVDSGLFCLVDGEGGVTCPGEPEFELQAMAQTYLHRGVYSHSGISYTCAHRLDDSLVCWNYSRTEFLNPIPTAVEAFAGIDGGVACWLLPDHTVACTGHIYNSPEGTFRSISLGTTPYNPFGCGIRTDNSLACWGRGENYGDDLGGDFLPPTGKYKSVSAADGHACAIRMDDTVACWGNEGSFGDPPSGAFRFISGSGHYHCGVRDDLSIECWGSGGRRQIDGAFHSVGVGRTDFGVGRYVCALHLDGTLECWVEGSYRRATPPDGKFQSISMGGTHACGVRTDGTVACWGGNRNDPHLMSPEGTFRSVTVGENQYFPLSCGIRTDGALTCWGNPESLLLQALVAKEVTTTR